MISFQSASARELLVELRDTLQRTRYRVVLVESCTAGLACGWLGQIPGISEYLCGSLVVYRNGSKHAWLDISQALLEDPDRGPVSAEASSALAVAALRRTPEAQVAAAITGHLGPDAPPHLDGSLYFSFVERDQPAMDLAVKLASPAPRDEHDWSGRGARQGEAAFRFLEALHRFLGNRRAQP